MAGLSQFQLMMSSSDDLLRAAQVGDKDALVELQKRGEMNPSPYQKPRFGRNAIDDGTPAPWRFGQNARDRTPVFALERGAPTRDMARPANNNGNTLPLMPAIFQQNEAPPHLGMSLGQHGTANTAPSDDPIAAIANGMDAAAPIQAGVRTADAEAAAAGAAPGAPTQLGISAMVDEEIDPNGYGGMIASLINDLRAGVNGPDKNRRRAFAEAGFGMAASGNPTFFGAVGQGGLAGLKSYRESEAADMEAQVRAATLGAKELERFEDIRKHKADESHDAAVLDETKTSNRNRESMDAKQLAETAQHNRAIEANARASQALVAAGHNLEAQRLDLATRQLDDTIARANRGEASDLDVKRAQADYYKAQAESTRLLGVDRVTDLVQDKDDFLMRASKEPGKPAEYVLDPQGNKVKATPGAETRTALDKNSQLYVDNGLFKTQAEALRFMAQGKSMSPDRKIIAAGAEADRVLAGYPSIMGDEYEAKRQELTQQFLGILGGTDTLPTLTPSTQAPTGRGGAATQQPQANPYKTPDEVKRAYQNKEISKDDAKKYINQLTAP